METTLYRSKEGMKAKIPEIKKALEIVEVLDKKSGTMNNKQNID